MNEWVRRKFQNQFKSQDVAHTALSKLQQLEDQKNVGKLQGKTSQETSLKGRNCSTLSGLNNTVSVPLSTDLLINTELNNVTTVEEICQDPGFQEFLSAQLNLYYKFIMNSSNNTILSSAKAKSSFTDNRQNGSISVHDPGTRRNKTPQYQNATGTTTSKEEFSKLLETQPGPALSSIQEEECGGKQDLAVKCSQIQNNVKERSVSNNNANAYQWSSSQPSRLTQRLKDKLLQKPVDGPNSSLPLSSKQINTVKKRSDKSPSKFYANEETTNTSIVDKQTRTRTNSTCSTAETSEQEKRRSSRTGRKRSSKTAAIDVAEVIAPQPDDNIFKKPLPPKRKANSSRSRNKRYATTEDHEIEDESVAAELQQTHGAVSKAPICQQPSVSQRIESELNDSLYRSRGGRISKPPGNFWNPLVGDKIIPTETKKRERLREPQTKEKVKPSSLPKDKEPLKSSEQDVDSESGYSSVISGRKFDQVSRVTRTALTQEIVVKSGTLEQAQKKTWAGVAKPPTNMCTLKGVNSVRDSETDAQVSADDVKKPRRERLRKTVSEKPVIENEEVATSAPLEKVAATKTKASKEVKVAQAQVVVNRNIFSDDHSSSEDESERISDEDKDRKQGKGAPWFVGQRRPLPNDILSVVEDSFDEEEPAKVRQPVRSRNAHGIKVASKLIRRQTREERVFMESSSDEEESDVVKTKKKQPAVKNARQTARKKQKESHVPEESPMVNLNAPGRPKGRFLFAGSSTEEESICSYRASSRNNGRAGSESFEVSSVRGTRSSRNKDIRLEEECRRPAMVSRFRIRK